MSGFYTPDQLRQIALKLATKRLASREHSTQELEIYLRLRDFPEEVIASTLANLTGQGLLDDRRYARALRCGRSRIRLDREDLFDDVVQAVAVTCRANLAFDGPIALHEPLRAPGN